MEPDQQTITPSNTLINVVDWNSAEDNSFNRSGQFVIQNATMKPRNDDAIASSGALSSSYARTILALHGGVVGIASSGVSTSDPNMKYPLRSALGATVDFRYVNRTLTSTPLWPWPN